ncbi:MAG: DNA-binding protein, partial [Alphaproteobacteria bacterium]|nr:DNA-binding protein [Alphaproteobacteria bacterium]
IDAWPRATRVDRRRFELLKRAYVEARYSPSYEINIEDLDALAASVERLRDVVEQLCIEQLGELKSAVSLI